MKRLADTPELLHQIQKQEIIAGKHRQVITAACFLDYKGNSLARSAEGMLRTLLYEVVSAQPELFQATEAEFERMKCTKSGVVWNLPALE
jgi:hypothetical protein